MIYLVFLEILDQQKKTIDELIERAKLSADNMTDDEKLKKFNKLFLENIQLKRKVRVLEEEIFKYKFEFNNSYLKT